MRHAAQPPEAQPPEAQPPEAQPPEAMHTIKSLHTIEALPATLLKKQACEQTLTTRPNS